MTYDSAENVIPNAKNSVIQNIALWIKVSATPTRESALTKKFPPPTTNTKIIITKAIINVLVLKGNETLESAVAIIQHPRTSGIMRMNNNPKINSDPMNTRPRSRENRLKNAAGSAIANVDNVASPLHQPKVAEE